MCLAHPVSDANLWLILLRCMPMVPKRMCEVLPLRLTFWIPIVVIYWFAALRKNRLIPLKDFRVTNLDSKSYKNLPPKNALERQEKEKKKKYCKPCENQRRISYPSWCQRTECSAMKPEHFSRGLQSCSQKNGRSPIQLKGVSLMLEWVSLVRATNPCIRGSRIPVSNMSSFIFSGSFN